MSEVATPVEPQAPAATPTAPVVETVSLSKEEHAELVRQAARATEAQSRADRLEKFVGKDKGGAHFKPAAPATPPSPEEIEAKASAEDRKAERGLMALASDPAYREVLDADPTLRNLLVTNPLAVLPMMANDALDADDAITLVKEALGKRKSTVAPATPPSPAPAVPPAPPAGGVNPQDKAVDEEYESARKGKNTEAAIAGMVKVGMKRLGGK